MKNCILINSYPVNETKSELLYKQIINLKSLNLPIILCSGCDIPIKIYNLVDYAIINKNKIIKPALYQKNKLLQNRGYVSALYINNLVMFNDFIDLTITENIKLLFTTAKFFGYDNVMYTEDDNLFINADDYIYDKLKILNTSQSKMCAYITKFAEHLTGLHTTHFFANVDFLLENYTFPHNVNDLDNFEHLCPWQCYEASIYKCFERKLDEIHIIDISEKHKYIDSDCSINRDGSVNYILNQRFLFVKLKNEQIRSYVINTSTNLDLSIKVVTKSSMVVLENFNPGSWHITDPVQFGDVVKLEITDKSTGNVLTREIKYDGEDKILAFEL